MHSSFRNGFVGLAAAFLLCAAAHAQSVAGKCLLAAVKQEALAIPDRDGHALVAVSFQCKNASVGQSEFLDGAQFTSWGTGDLTNGTGQTSGYAQILKGNDSTISKWSGSVVTTASKDGTPRTVYVGTWTFVGGTGKYKGATGSGNFYCPFVSTTECAFEWGGDLIR